MSYVYFSVEIVGSRGSREMYVRNFPITWIESLSLWDEPFFQHLSVKSTVYLIGGFLIFRGQLNGLLTLNFTPKNIVAGIIYLFIVILSFYNGKSMSPEAVIVAAINFYFEKAFEKVGKAFSIAEERRIKKKSEEIRKRVLPPAVKQEEKATEEAEKEKAEKKQKVKKSEELKVEGKDEDDLLLQKIKAKTVVIVEDIKDTAEGPLPWIDVDEGDGE